MSAEEFAREMTLPSDHLNRSVIISPIRGHGLETWIALIEHVGDCFLRELQLLGKT